MKRSMQKTLALLCLLGSAAVFYFFVWGEYDQYVAESDRLATLERSREDARETLRSLEDLEEIVESPGVQAELTRYAGPFREDFIIDSILG